MNTVVTINELYFTARARSHTHKHTSMHVIIYSVCYIKKLLHEFLLPSTYIYYDVIGVKKPKKCVYDMHNI